jgi:hypothetical protein
VARRGVGEQVVDGRIELERARVRVEAADAPDGWYDR